MFREGDTLVGLLTENAKEQIPAHSKRIEIKTTEVDATLAKIPRKRLRLPPETEAIFLDWPLEDMMRRVILGLCPPDISRLFDDLGDGTQKPPELHEFFHRLAEWELREPGTLSRCSLREARKKYPMRTPCCVLIGGVPLFATLQDDGVVVFPDGIPPEYFELVHAILKTSNLLNLPVKKGGTEVTLTEEFMNELKSLYDEVVDGKP